MHAFGQPSVLLLFDDVDVDDADADADEVTISSCASAKYFVNMSSNVLGSLEYHDPA